MAAGKEAKVKGKKAFLYIKCFARFTAYHGLCLSVFILLSQWLSSFSLLIPLLVMGVAQAIGCYAVAGKARQDLGPSWIGLYLGAMALTCLASLFA